jgi:predicted RecA/RadA family phage recombinase
VCSHLFGVIARAGLVGGQVANITEGVHGLQKLASAAIAAGVRVAWDNTARQINVPAVGRFPF